MKLTPEYKEYVQRQQVQFKSFESENQHWMTGQRRFIKEWLLNYKDKKILDVACGDGVGLRYFKELNFADVTGMEFDHIKVLRASMHFPVIEQDFHDQIYGQYDLIYSSHSLEHALDPSVVLKNFHDHCKELIIVLPYPDVGPIEAHCAKLILGTNILDNGESVVRYIESFGFKLQKKRFDSFRENEIWMHFEVI